MCIIWFDKKVPEIFYVFDDIIEDEMKSSSKKMMKRYQGQRFYRWKDFQCGNICSFVIFPFVDAPVISLKKYHN